MVVVYNFNVIGKFADPILHRYVACLEWLQNNPPLDVEFQVNVEEYFETPSENRKRDVCQQFGGKFLQHRSGCLIYATVDEGNNGKIDKVLFFQDDSRFFPWVSKYFSFKDEAHYLSFKRAGKKAHQKEIKRTGRSYLKLETRLIDGTQRIIEVELFSEILPISADQFIERFEHGIVDQLKRIKQNQFLHFGIPGKQPIKCVPPESYQFRHSQPGLLGFCQNSSGELDLNNWYITLAPLPQLDDKKYVIFGRIITGMRACWQLSKLQTSWIGKPLDDHQIGGFGNVKIIPKVQKKGGGEISW